MSLKREPLEGEVKQHQKGKGGFPQVFHTLSTHSCLLTHSGGQHRLAGIEVLLYREACVKELTQFVRGDPAVL